jgi:2-oxoacid:acceptor oxidoreductase delta subunit (pyruvate/2-ketoisovalerate family)
MPELKRWDELTPGGTIDASDAPPIETGDWRTNGRPLVQLDACVNCLLCWLYCPDSAIELDGTTLAGIDYRTCKGCELCVEVCPVGAIAMVAEVDA